MPDLTKFSLSDMVVCGAALRRMADGATCMEEVAERMVRFLYQSLRDTTTGEKSCVLIRFFKSHPFKDLDPDLQAYARAKLAGQPESPDMKCLTLLGTVGDDPAWNSRKTSARYKSIPLASEEFVAQFPMVAQLLDQLGLATKWLLNLSPELLVDLEQRTHNVFYVPDALGSSYVPVQQDFVMRYGIKSVLGIGGLLPSGHLFTILLFSRVFIPRDVADLFRTLVVSAKVAILPFDQGPVFLPAGARAAVGGSVTSVQPEQLRSQVATLEQLLEIHERTVGEQSSRLEQALDETYVRARQQAAVAELGRRALETVDLSGLLDEAIALVCRTLELPYGQVFEWRPDEVTLSLRAAVGFRTDLIGAPLIDAGMESQAGYTLRSNKAVIVEDLKTETRFGGAPLLRDLGVVSGVSVVIQGLDRPFGVLAAYATLRRAFTQEDVGFLEAIATLLSHAMERRQAEQTLRSHVMAMEASMDGMAVLDEQERFVYLNEAHARVHGYAGAGELLGRSWRVLYEPGELKRFEQEVIPVLLAKGHWRGEAIGRRQDGSSFDQEVSLTRLAQGGYVCVVRDITDRKKLEEELRQSQKMEAIGQLAGGIAHDFNNLLTAILGYGEILRSKLEQSPLRDAAAQIIKAGMRAAALTHQLLAFGRRQVLQATVLNVNTVVADTATMLQRLIGEHITLVTKPSAELGLVRADPVQLQQVILNLAINSRDAMPQGGRLTIETANVDLAEADVRRQAGVKAGPYVRLTVRDTGQGMDQATMSRIFEPFFTTKEVGKGTGLGLAMVYGTVKQSGGFIDVQSRPGQGATFSIYLPRLQEPAGEAAVEPRRATSLRGRETILVVEDEDQVRGLARQVLQTRGYSVLEARDGAEALEVFRACASDVHLLLTDAVLPLMGGRELATRLTAERPEVRVLYMSGYGDDSIPGHSSAQSSTTFLQKPFTPDALLERVRAVLDA